MRKCGKGFAFPTSPKRRGRFMDGKFARIFFSCAGGHDMSLKLQRNQYIRENIVKDF